MSVALSSVLFAALLMMLCWQLLASRRARRRHERLQERHDEAVERIQRLEQELSALCNASVGAGEHLLRMEQQMQRLIERQNGLEMRSAGDRPYSQATQLVTRGAGVEELVESCGLTRGEAELLIMMQRGAA